MTKSISQSVLEEVYNKVKTPYKYGAVIKIDGMKVDSPVVFYDAKKYYMSFIGIDFECKNGYSTFLAESDDLIKWGNIRSILGKPNEWDKTQSGGYAQFIDNIFCGSNQINKIADKYIFAYIGGNASGYETDPLSMGIAETSDFLDNEKYTRHRMPVLSGNDTDARDGETLTIYKADMFIDEREILGHRYVCAYNAKDRTQKESIFLAVSDDGTIWKRYGERAIISVKECSDDTRINGDPQIVKIDDYYVMFYFILDKKGVYNTFAVSEDLRNWTKWSGEPIMKSEKKWKNVYAHKQWIIKSGGVVYQYYSAVNDKGERFIALATSIDLGNGCV